MTKYAETAAEVRQLFVRKNEIVNELAALSSSARYGELDQAGQQQMTRLLDEQRDLNERMRQAHLVAEVRPALEFEAFVRAAAQPVG